MSKRTLTDRTIRAMKPAPEGQRVELLDAIVPGLGIRVTDKGAKTFFLRARFPGASAANHPTRRALGAYGAISLEQARTKARGWLEQLHKGLDPALVEEQARREATLRQADNFAAVAEAFIEHAQRTGQRKARELGRDIRNEFVERWGSRPIASITAQDVVAVIDAAVARGATYQAHNLFGHVRRLFGWAIARGVYNLEASPCDRLKPKDLIGKRAMRTRVLSDAELRAFWRAVGAMKYPWRQFFQLLLMTMQRRSEVSDAERSELDIENALWSIPAARMKMDAAHVVPLAPLAVQLFASVPAFARGEHLFSTTAGEKPISGFSKAKSELDKRMLAELRKAGGDAVKLEPWGLHDLRRTGRTALSSMPVPETVRELVIAHTKRGLHKVYDQHAYLDEKREALMLWADKLRTICEIEETECVHL